MNRTGNPTRGAFERALAAVEHAKYGIAFASGLSATAAIITTLKSGDHIICIDDVYGGTQRYFRQVVTPNSGMMFSFMDLSEPSKIQDAIKENTKLIWLGTMRTSR